MRSIADEMFTVARRYAILRSWIALFASLGLHASLVFKPLPPNEVLMYTAILVAAWVAHDLFQLIWQR